MSFLDRLDRIHKARSVGPWSLGRSSEYGGPWHPQVWPSLGAPIVSADGRPSGRVGAPKKDAADFLAMVTWENTYSPMLDLARAAERHSESCEAPLGRCGICDALTRLETVARVSERVIAQAKEQDDG